MNRSVCVYKYANVCMHVCMRMSLCMQPLSITYVHTYILNTLILYIHKIDRYTHTTRFVVYMYV